MYRDDLIRSEQAARRLTLEQLAEKSGVHQHTVRAICNGKETVQVATLNKVATALNISLHRLFEPKIQIASLNRRSTDL